MNPVRTYDSGPATVAMMISRANGGKATAQDFMPYGKEVRRETLNDYMTALGPGIRVGKGVKRGIQ